MKLSNFEADYRNLVDNVAEYFGQPRTTRAGPTKQLFGMTLRIDCLRNGEFPILTQRKIFYKPVLGELAAFLEGAVDLRDFKKYGCNYWDANAAAWDWNKDREPEDHCVGQIYGAVWRNFNGVDQLRRIVTQLKHDPNSRRILLTAYDPSEEWQCLPPCHVMAQFNCNHDGTVDCLVFMRSLDLCLGLPSDIILYATLLLVLCNESGRMPGSLIFMVGDCHVYENHIPIWKEHRAKPTYQLPNFRLSRAATINNFKPEMLDLVGYLHGEKLEYPFAV